MKKHNIYTLVIALAIFILPIMIFGQAAALDMDEKLHRKWATDEVFLVPESVCYDEARDVLYVANINGQPSEKDNNGFISTLSTNGELIDLDWIGGLHAPKGMGIYGNKLYVTDIDRVAEIDIEKREIIGFHEIKGAQFLNDITVDEQGNVYVSDMIYNKIFVINGQELGLFLDDEQLTGPNGLYYLDGYLYVGCKKILKINTETKEIELYAENTGSIDGLEYADKKRFLFSDWTGNVYIINKRKKIKNLLNTETANMNAADIEYIIDQKMLFVPTFFDNRVVAYELK